MATLVQNIPHVMPGSATSDTLSITTTGGNAIFVVCQGGTTGDLTSVTDSASNPGWTVVAASNGSGAHAGFGWLLNASAVTSVTLNLGVSEKAAYNVLEVSGLTGTSVTPTGNTGASATSQTTASITAAATDFVLAVIAVTTGSNALTRTTGGFNDLTLGTAGVGSGKAAYTLSAAGGATSVNWTLASAGTAGMVIGAFSTGSPNPPLRLAMQAVHLASSF